MGFEFPEGYQNYPFKIVWDIEVSLKPHQYIPQTKRRRIEQAEQNERVEEEQNNFYIADHCLLSIACFTNFRHPNLESTVCFVREGDEWDDSQRLMDKIVDYWDSVQNLAKDHL